MKKEVIASMDLSYMPTISLILFFCVFIGSLIWVHRRGSSKLYNEIGQEALNDGNVLMAKEGVK